MAPSVTTSSSHWMSAALHSLVGENPPTMISRGFAACQSMYASAIEIGFLLRPSSNDWLSEIGFFGFPLLSWKPRARVVEDRAPDAESQAVAEPVAPAVVEVPFPVEALVAEAKVAAEAQPVVPLLRLGLLLRAAPRLRPRRPPRRPPPGRRPRPILRPARTHQMIQMSLRISPRSYPAPLRRFDRTSASL